MNKEDALAAHTPQIPPNQHHSVPPLSPLVRRMSRHLSGVGWEAPRCCRAGGWRRKSWEMEQKATKFKTLEELHAAAVAFAQDPSQRAESAGSADSSYIDDESTRERAMVLLQSWLDSTEDKPIVSEPMKAFLSKPCMVPALPAHLLP